MQAAKIHGEERRGVAAFLFIGIFLWIDFKSLRAVLAHCLGLSRRTVQKILLKIVQWIFIYYEYAFYSLTILYIKR